MKPGESKKAKGGKDTSHKDEVAKLKKEVAKLKTQLETEKRLALTWSKDQVEAERSNFIFHEVSQPGFNWSEFKADPGHVLKHLFRK